MRKLIGLAVLAMVAIVAFGALDASDAEAKKKKHRVFFAPLSPPAYNIVACNDDTTCLGTPGSDVMVGAAGNESLQGAEGDDIYMGSAGGFDGYVDHSTSNDLYGGFQNGQVEVEVIVDDGGVDMLDLSTSTSAYATRHFDFRRNQNGGGPADELTLQEKNVENLNGDDTIIIGEYFGPGQIEQIKFSDKTLTPADVQQLTG